MGTCCSAKKAQRPQKPIFIPGKHFETTEVEAIDTIFKKAQKGWNNFE